MSSTSASRLLPFLAPVVLVAAACLAYANSLSVPFLLDDWATIVQNPHLAHPWPLWRIFTPPEDTGVGGRPIANLFFVLNHAISGSSLAGFHIGNLVLHCLAGLALHALLRHTLAGLPASNPLTRHTQVAALVAAAFWTLQPLQTQSVTYISQRTEILLGLFYFLTLYAFARATAPGASWRWAVTAVLACCAGMASKEGMVTAPVIAFVYDWAFVSGSPVEAWRRHRRLHLSLAASWLLLPFLMMGLHGRGVGFGHGMGMFDYLLIECGAIVRYLSLSAWPWPLIFDYGTDLPPAGAWEFACATSLLALAALSVWALWRRHAWGFLIVWFLVTLAPTSSVVPIPLQPIAENRAYVPSAAVAVGLVALACSALGSRARPILAALVIALVGLTLARNRDYRSDVNLLLDTIAKRPTNARTHNNLGHALQNAGRWPEARDAYNAALRLRPDYADAHANIASILGRLGDVDAALRHSRRAVELDPKNPTAHNNLGVATRDKGLLLEAIAAFETALRLQPHLVVARDNLAHVLWRAQRIPEAIAHAEIALRLNPASIDMRHTFACLLSVGGRAEESLPHFQEVLKARPNHLEAMKNLGLTLKNLGRLPEAIEVFKAIIRIAPDHADANTALGDILTTAGRPADAVAHYALVARANPNLAEAQANLGLALVRAGRNAEALEPLKTARRLNPNLAPVREILRQLSPPATTP